MENNKKIAKLFVKDFFEGLFKKSILAGSLYKMQDISDHLIVKSRFSEKKLTVSCKEGKFLVPDAEVVVFWKQKFHRIHVQQIGDGMKLVLCYPPHKIPKLSVHAVETWLCLYQEYDESTDNLKTYLYKYSWGETWRMIVNNYLKTSGSTCFLMTEKWFTRVLWTTINVSSLLPTFSTFTDQLSCLVGVCLWYGKPKQITSDRCLSRHVVIPLVWSLAMVYPLLQKLIEDLAREGVFMVCSEQQQKVGSLLQITLYDEQLLDILSKIWLGTTPAQSRYTHLSQELADMIWEAHKRWENSVLKFVTK